MIESCYDRNSTQLHVVSSTRLYIDASLGSPLIFLNTCSSVFSISLGRFEVCGFEVVGWKEVVVVTVDEEIRSLSVDISRLRMVDTFAPSGVNKSTGPPN